MKYKLVCSVSISGEHIGYVQDKELDEKQINDKLALEGTGNVAYVDCTTPEYSLTFISNNTEVNDDYVIAKIEENTKIKYSDVLTLVLLLVIYHPVMAVNNTITMVEKNVINIDQPKALKNPVFDNPSI